MNNEMDECHYETLYEEANGVITRCLQCGRMQLAYGTSHYILYQWQLRRLERKLTAELLKAQNCKCYDRKHFSIPVEHHVSRLFLSINEAAELSNILQQALWMASVKDTLKE